MAYKILMVDDNLRNLDATKGFLEINGLVVEVTASTDEAMARLRDEEYALVLLDFQMPGMNGDVLAAKIREINPSQQVAMYSCDATKEAEKQSYQAGAINYLAKNINPERLLGIIQSYCHRYEMLYRTIRPIKDESENAKLLHSIGMVGGTQVMAKVAEKIVKLGEASNISVFISGESGTGKELAAQALHDLSGRKGKFVAINCSAIPRDLLESELFGHMQGAFTGATANKEGKFVMANGGTIFLDEICEMPMELQAKLLRVVQERTVDPLGARFSKNIDVRIITASHKNLEEQVKSGTFREDLKYRIKVADIILPPLRDRTEDIEPLVGHFTRIYNKRHGINRHFQRRTLDILKRYTWPGNVRELGNVVERHLVQANSPEIRPEDLDLNLYAIDELLAGRMSLTTYEERQGSEKMNFILTTIAGAGDNKAEAARRLGITPTHLQYLLSESKAAKSKEKREKVRIANV